MSDATDIMNAGITAKERLERIEMMLGRIDEKLDSKASLIDLMALEARVRDIELHGTVVARETRQEVEKAKSRSEALTVLINELRIKTYVAIGLANGALAAGIYFIDRFVR